MKKELTTAELAEALRAIKPTQRFLAEPDCPGFDLQWSYLSGSMKRAEKNQYEAHLARCDVCRSIIAEAVRANLEPPAEENTPVSTTPPSPAYIDTWLKEAEAKGALSPKRTHQPRIYPMGLALASIIAIMILIDFAFMPKNAQIYLVHNSEHISRQEALS